jgi:hypothetical protein
LVPLHCQVVDYRSQHPKSAFDFLEDKTVRLRIFFFGLRIALELSKKNRPECIFQLNQD